MRSNTRGRKPEDNLSFPVEPHKPYEDILAVLLGTLTVSLGITLYGQATLLTSSTAGLALLLHYGTGMPFGAVFTMVNLPFYAFGWCRMGWRPMVRTIVAVTLVSIFTRFNADWVTLKHVEPIYASILGGTLIGLGLLGLMRHRTGLGGINILALYLQERLGLRAGYVQLAVDAVLMLCACLVIPPDKVALSAMGAMLLNGIILINFKPGRYTGVSA